MRLLVATVLLVLSSGVRAETSELTTYYEASGYTRTPRYDETIEFCKQLAGESRWIHYTSFGKSPQGRDLPLVIANKDQTFDANRIRRKKQAVVLIQACIHAGESDGKDAGFVLLRDIAITKALEHLIDYVTVLFVPILNVDGHERFGPFNRINQNGPEEMGWRVTAQNLNLNRDYLKVDSPEVRAWLKLFNDWRPDFFVDCHVTDGADYQYVLTYILEIHGNMTPQLTEWTRDVYLAPMKQKMAAAGYDIIPYVFLLDWPNPKAGMQSWVATPRFSTGYTALRNCPGITIETHMLKDYKTRVTATYEMLKQTIELIGRERKTLREAIEASDTYVASADFRGKPYPLQFKHGEESTPTAFKGIDYESVESDVSGGTWHRFNGKPVTFDVPYYEQQIATVTAELPEAYLIPPEWTEVIERLELHGVETRRLDRERLVQVTSYRFRNVSWAAKPFEGRHPVSFEVETLEEKRLFPKGTVVIDMKQALAPVAAHVLEPRGPDSYVSWGFFDTIFEQKEHASSYVMEERARDMLESDPALRTELWTKKAADAEFAKNPRAILNWFYSKTPYWDEQLGVYPIGKVFDRATVDRL